MGAERVIGTLPNLVANRINTQLDLAGPGFAVSAEEASGLVALTLAARAIRAGEADAALVGATDVSSGAVHRAALNELGRETDTGDAAVVLVLKPLAAARRDGDTVLALLDEDGEGEADLLVGDDAAATVDPAAVFGRVHAAQGLLAVAVAATALPHRAVPRPGAPAEPRPGLRSAVAVVTPLEAPPRVSGCAPATRCPGSREPRRGCTSSPAATGGRCWPRWSGERSPRTARLAWHSSWTTTTDFPRPWRARAVGSLAVG